MPGHKPHSSQPWDDLDLFAAQPRHERRKPIIRVVCPLCANLVAVNALEVEGVTETTCAKCLTTTISVTTDDDGRIVGIEAWSNVVVEKAPPKPKADWKVYAGFALFGLLALLLFLNLLRPVVTSNAPSPPAGTGLPEKAGTVSPNKPAMPGEAPAPSVTPTSLDMFAPEKD